MDVHAHAVGTLLHQVRERLWQVGRCRTWTVGLTAASVAVSMGWGVTSWLADAGAALVVASVATLLVMGVVLTATARSVPAPPAARAVARLVEERVGGLDDLLVTLVDHEAQPLASVEALRQQADRALRDVAVDAVVPFRAVTRATRGLVASGLALVLALAGVSPSLWRASQVARAFLFPAHIEIVVDPGPSRVRRGAAVQVAARISGVEGLTPSLLRETDTGNVVEPMPRADDGRYVWSLAALDASVTYRVTAGPVTTEAFRIEAIDAAALTRIDLTYRYPDAMREPARTDADSGDIFGPRGTRVTVDLVFDKPVVSGALQLGTGQPLTAERTPEGLRAHLTIDQDTTYRVAARDGDGLDSTTGVEYFIRMLNDRPPDVRIARPGGDRQVTPLEEVLIEAVADDDFAVAALEIVVQRQGKAETVVPVRTHPSPQVTGRYVVAMEDLGVTPGEMVSYHARARDVGRGRAATEVRSDIYFLEVKPYEETFRAAQTQAASGQMSAPEVQALVDAQKEIIAATWKLDARAQRAGASAARRDLNELALAQRALRDRVLEEAGNVAQALADPTRRRRQAPPGAGGAPSPMALAAEAMGDAADELERARPRQALPREMAALEQLLKADADVKERQIARQQGNGRAGNRQSPDMSTLFDQQLRQQQQTNYETPTTTETREETPPEADPLARIRELARRQETLQRQQEELARNRERLAAEEARRQLERLTREQQQLTEQAASLARDLRTPSSPSQGGADESRAVQQAAEQMRSAAGDLQRKDPSQASARSGRAAEALRNLSRQMERAQPDARQRALGDLQFEARQLAEAERRLATEAEQRAARTPGTGGTSQPGTTTGATTEASRRLAAEQHRLADRAAQLRDAAKQLARGLTPDREPDPSTREQQQAAVDAARTLERSQLDAQMRGWAERLGTRPESSALEAAAQARDLARALDRVAGQLGEAAGVSDREGERLSASLQRTGELRTQLADVQRALDALAREGETPDTVPDRQRRLGQLQRDAQGRLGEARALAEELQQANPELRQSPTTPEDWRPSLSDPGTEAFKQDLTRWESLKRQLLAAVDRTERRLTDALRARMLTDRLPAGGAAQVADEYRPLVDQYFQTLPTPRRPRP
jgi:hypothetical protein